MTDANRIDYCGQCYYASEAPADPNQIGRPRGLICARFPPQSHLIQMPGGGVASVSAWPTVQPDQTCGEFKNSMFNLEGKFHAC